MLLHDGRWMLKRVRHDMSAMRTKLPHPPCIAKGGRAMSDSPDYKSTVFLPKTDFPMKAGLPQKEPQIAARWEDEGLYKRLREARAGRDKFILHDGPPYANGDIHVGHALNHTLKDMVCRTQSLLGKDAPYVPGWDCHGLPIEWKVEEQYRKKKRDKKAVPPREFRAECRAYAARWVDVQRGQLKRLYRGPVGTEEREGLPAGGQPEVGMPGGSLAAGFAGGEHDEVAPRSEGTRR